MAGFCRDCLTDLDENGDVDRCLECGSPRVLLHPELSALSMAHIDCDSFYASVEKRDDESLRDKPVIVGGGTRGVVSAACYIARTYGVRSAMPMFKAKRLCPDAAIIKPNMEKYAAVSREIRAIFRDASPLIEPLSLDEAFLDLKGTERLHKMMPAKTLAHLINRIEDKTSVTASVGLSYNKFLAKVASDLDKPRGFAVVGRSEAVAFLGRQHVSIIWGAGQALQRKLARDGITHVHQLQNMNETDLVKRYGAMGQRMARFSRGVDNRRINPRAPTKSVSSETTFNNDISDANELDRILWRQSERVAKRLKKSDLAGSTVNLKLRTPDFQIRTRSSTISNPTQLADIIYRHAHELLLREADGTPFRLLGVGLSSLVEGVNSDPIDLGDPGGKRRAQAERALDDLRDKFGDNAIGKGRGLKS